MRALFGSAKPCSGFIGNRTKSDVTVSVCVKFQCACGSLSTKLLFVCVRAPSLGWEPFLGSASAHSYWNSLIMNNSHLCLTDLNDLCLEPIDTKYFFRLETPQVTICFSFGFRIDGKFTYNSVFSRILTKNLLN